LPDDYDSEEEDDSSGDDDDEISDATSSSMSSMLVSPAAAAAPASRQKDQANMEEIDRIIREAKEQKRKLQDMASESESSLSESGFDERYL
jgi:hypothetical protein